MDSGASEHMSHDKHILINYKEIKCSKEIILVDAKNFQAVGIGDLKFLKQGSILIYATAYRRGKLYIMNLNIQIPMPVLWHEKLGHQDIEQVKSILKRSRIECTLGDEQSTCLHCVKGKLHKQ
ncbi:hypothetical protein PR048_016566 [Dryococelus australis]|uniref:Retrovirus-related Pol polyprotein from transposon TNT 1-94-like beta-barrel domain-containing protein n=1 Tax=Dryococelus australis TaxID=614101 RepID=A0ABQ9HLC6_9NEOP|nr:hypothetical protein PR048_016566 [Dryococelus australis]